MSIGKKVAVPYWLVQFMQVISGDLQELNGHRIRQVGLLVDGGHVEVRHVGEAELLECFVVVVLVEDGEESIVERDVGQPEHGAREEVEEVLDLELHEPVGREDRLVDVGDVVGRHVAEKTRLLFGSQVRDEDDQEPTGSCF